MSMVSVSAMPSLAPAPTGNFAARFPAYQIDFSAKCSGKRIASSKRNIRWRFGFPNREALEAGHKGIACRGDEHDVTIIWSVTSGKRQVIMDGQEVHFSSNRGNIMEYSWSMRGNRVVKVVAHASPPLNVTPGFRQYDMFIDGQSFFHMPKVFELGLRGPIPPNARVPGVLASNPHYGSQRLDYPLQSQEDIDLQRAVKESLEESRLRLSQRSGRLDEHAPTASQASTGRRNYQDHKAPVGNAPSNGHAAAASSDLVGSTDLLDFDYNYSGSTGAPPMLETPSVVSYQTAPFYSNASYSAPNDMMSPGMASVASAPPSYANAPFSPQQPVPPVNDPFAPRPPPPPSHSDISNAILGAYGPRDQHMPATPFYPGPPNSYQSPMAGEPLTIEAAPEPQKPQGFYLSMSRPLEAYPDEIEAQPKSGLESALKQLVNFDDISAPAEKDIKLFTMKKPEKKDLNKSRAIPPVAAGYVGSGATLSQIKSVKPETPQKDPTSIMKPPQQLFSPHAVNAGALVIHGQEPPPLQQQGFGVGAQMGYGMYQQPSYGYAPPPQPTYGHAPPPQPSYGYAPPQQQAYSNY